MRCSDRPHIMLLRLLLGLMLLLAWSWMEDQWRLMQTLFARHIVYRRSVARRHRHLPRACVAPHVAHHSAPVNLIHRLVRQLRIYFYPSIRPFDVLPTRQQILNFNLIPDGAITWPPQLLRLVLRHNVAVRLLSKVGGSSIRILRSLLLPRHLESLLNATLRAVVLRTPHLLHSFHIRRRAQALIVELISLSILGPRQDNRFVFGVSAALAMLLCLLRLVWVSILLWKYIAGRVVQDWSSLVPVWAWRLDLSNLSLVVLSLLKRKGVWVERAHLTLHILTFISLIVLLDSHWLVNLLNSGESH